MVVTRTILGDEQIAKLGQDLAQARDDVRWIGLNQTNILLGFGIIVLTLVVTFSVDWVKETTLFAGLLGLVAAAAPVTATCLTALHALAQRGVEFRRRSARAPKRRSSRRPPRPRSR